MLPCPIPNWVYCMVLAEFAIAAPLQLAGIVREFLTLVRTDPEVRSWRSRYPSRSCPWLRGGSRAQTNVAQSMAAGGGIRPSRSYVQPL
jgi:hypothetical protein